MGSAKIRQNTLRAILTAILTVSLADICSLLNALL